MGKSFVFCQNCCKRSSGPVCQIASVYDT